MFVSQLSFLLSFTILILSFILLQSTCSSVEYRKRLDGILHIVERKHRLEAKVTKVRAHTNASMNMSMSFNLGPGGFSALLAGVEDDEEKENTKGNLSKTVTYSNGNGKSRRIMADEEPLTCIQYIMRMIN